MLRGGSRAKGRYRVFFIVAVFLMTLTILGCSGSKVREEPTGQFDWRYDKYGEYALSDVESREFASSLAKEGVSQATLPEYCLGNPIPAYRILPDGAIEEYVTVYPRFRGETLTALIYVSKVMHRGAAGEAFIQVNGLDRFADILERGDPCYLVECDAWDMGGLLVSSRGEMRDVGNLAASDSASDAAQKDWGSKMGEYADKLSWWEPIGRTCLLAK